MWKALWPVILLLAPPVTALAAAPGQSAECHWLTEKKSGIIEIYHCADDTLCGKLVWLRIKPGDENQAALDVNNPDPNQRDRSLCGIVLMTGFKLDEPNHWTDGFVYNPEDGDDYHGTMTLQPGGTLRLRGYVGISLLGASEVWTRFTETVPPCPAR